MDTPALTDPAQAPTEFTLRSALQGAYPALQTLLAKIGSEPLALSYEWRYYKDGHSWLGKVTHKKKTVVWLSVWEGHFKLGFYFAPRLVDEVLALDLSAETKERFRSAQPIGKLHPLLLQIHDSAQLADAFTILSFRKTAK